MEELNLASSRLGTRVCCSGPSRDSHPASRLLEGGSWMADSFLRPPVSLTLHLPCPVRLHSVSWGCRVGEHSSLVHEVWAASGAGACSGDCGVSRSGGVRWLRVGRGSAVEGRMVFANRRSVHVEGAERLGCGEDRGLLERVRTLRITIIFTERASVPCLGGLDVRGVAGLGAERGVEARLVALGREEEQTSGQGGFSFFGGAPEVEEEEKPGSVVIDPPEESDSTPGEFLDSITLEVMVIPMTLPSGHTVDRSTVQR